MSHIVSDRNSHTVLRTLIGIALLLIGLAASVMAILTLPWLIFRVMAWAAR